MTFDYRCDGCDKTHDRVFPLAVAPPQRVDCPFCQSQAARVWSVPMFESVAATEFAGKFGPYPAKTYDHLKYDCWPDAPVDTTPKIEVNGVERQTYRKEDVKAMAAAPIRRVPKKRNV